MPPLSRFDPSIVSIDVAGMVRANRFGAACGSSGAQHSSIPEAAGLIVGEKRGQYVFYRLVPASLANTLNGFVQEVCPVSRPLKRESATLARKVADEP